MPGPLTHDLAVVGSGFAGTILARAARSRGLDVALVDRAIHPRFALGESSTPLAAASLERLAATYDLPDLHDLAAWGRWTARLPQLRRGLKRGFTFYHHPANGGPFRPDPGNRLLVAASPTDAVADCHWMREDVDAFLVRRARLEGVRVREGAEIVGVARASRGFRLTLATSAGPESLDARWLVDASGPAGVAARRLGAVPRPPAVPERGLLYAHLGDVSPFAPLADPGLPQGPYPDETAAVHHLFEGGWAYRLPFDHGVSSCGLILLRPAVAAGPDPAASDPAVAVGWHLDRRAPALARQWAEATAVRPWRWLPFLGHRLDRAAGDSWIALPHAVAFADPLFSTGIAWSLRGVERVLDVLEGRGAVGAYDERTGAEADRIEALVRLAWQAFPHPDAFRGVALLYFASVSFQESRERLLDPDASRPFAWDGFLGVGDPAVDGWFASAEERLARDPAGFAAWVGRAIGPRDVAGLSAPGKEGLYGVDLDDLIRGAGKLGLGSAETRRRVARLRGILGLDAGIDLGSGLPDPEPRKV